MKKLTLYQKLILLCVFVWFAVLTTRTVMFENEWATTDHTQLIAYSLVKRPEMIEKVERGLVYHDSLGFVIFHKPVSHKSAPDTVYYDDNPYIPCSPDMSICMTGESEIGEIDSCGRILYSCVNLPFYPFYTNGDIHRNLDKYGRLLR